MARPPHENTEARRKPAAATADTSHGRFGADCVAKYAQAASSSSTTSADDDDDDDDMDDDDD